MAKPNPRGHRPTDSPDTFTREGWEQEVRCLDPQLFDQIAQGRRTFTLRELRSMPELTDSMRGSLRTGLHGCEAVSTLNGELYRAQWFAAEALARTDLATHRDALAVAGWATVDVRA